MARSCSRWNWGAIEIGISQTNWAKIPAEDFEILTEKIAPITRLSFSRDKENRNRKIISNRITKPIEHI